ncbi:MAG: NarK/NasA family nitrate transporter [Actinobacteria bacterium]|nr:NarK/NasA family nitrate transporter [Actinomycetota bacterium]MCB8997988.1 NarK/NasA family nitrate transporter [Actinomycetota bacterium]MCB9414415.1 NarK/NasA family nitrate transporter [Actinomycetota bacterium]MCB9424700.1 NarK/NasA family nitrate transporter [Actinomycetota bacterium]HRY09397.1 MFS transporter [Candidatus Nanopelagicales bacterium]
MSAVSSAPTRKGGDWLDSWNPEDAATWDSGRAWKTLWITTFNLTLAFITWFLVSAIAPQLNNIGFDLSKGQLYWLAAMPGLAGGFLRLVWMFLPPILGTRKLVWMSSLLLVIPLVGWALAVQNSGTSYTVLLLLAFLAGVGGGVFSGFMPSTSYFFPKAKQGTALGIQAGIGNFGVSIVQFVTPWIIGFALIGGSQAFVNEEKGINKEVWYQNAGYVWIPFVIVGVILAYTMLRSVPVQARGVKDQLDIFGNKHTWLMTWLYVLTFGTFSGMAAQFALLIKNFYGTPFGAEGINPVSYAFLGALVGSAARVLAGPVADRVGGAKVTLVAVLGIGLSALYTSFQLSPTSVDTFPSFLWGMLAIFFFAGVGNASTFKQMPMIFEPRQAGGVIGWTAAIAAFGPFVFGVMFATGNAQLLYWLGTLSCGIGAVLTWWFYARPGAEKPS